MRVNEFNETWKSWNRWTDDDAGTEKKPASPFKKILESRIKNKLLKKENPERGTFETTGITVRPMIGTDRVEKKPLRRPSPEVVRIAEKITERFQQEYKREASLNSNCFHLPFGQNDRVMVRFHEENGRVSVLLACSHPFIEMKIKTYLHEIASIIMSKNLPIHEIKVERINDERGGRGDSRREDLEPDDSSGFTARSLE